MRDTEKEEEKEHVQALGVPEPSAEADEERFVPVERRLAAMAEWFVLLGRHWGLASANEKENAEMTNTVEEQEPRSR